MGIGNNCAIPSHCYSGNCTFCGDQFVMYGDIASLCHLLRTNIALSVSYTTKTNTQTHRKSNQACGYQRQGVEGVGRGS